MSLSVTGVWETGVWAQTVFVDGFWREGAFATPVAVEQPAGGTSKRRGRHRQRYYSDEEPPTILEAPPTQAQLDAILARSTAPIDEEMEDDDDALLHAILAITLQ